MTPPRVVFFDVGGLCLTNGWDRGSREEAARRFGLDFDEVERRHEALYAEFERGEVDLDGYLEKVVFFRSRSFSRELFVEFMKGRSRAHDGVLEIVRRLRDSGAVRLATINNESRALNDYRIERFGLRKLFEAFFTSCYLGVRKPSERIFRTAVEVMGLAVEEAIFLDDREENVAAARLVGLQGALVHDEAGVSAALQEVGVSI